MYPYIKIPPHPYIWITSILSNLTHARLSVLLNKFRFYTLHHKQMISHGYVLSICLLCINVNCDGSVHIHSEQWQELNVWIIVIATSTYSAQHLVAPTTNSPVHTPVTCSYSTELHDYISFLPLSIHNDFWNSCPLQINGRQVTLPHAGSWCSSTI